MTIGVGRTLLSVAVDFDFDLDVDVDFDLNPDFDFDFDREGHGFRPCRKAPQKRTRLQPLREPASPPGDVIREL
jgi:hypothetical protein